MVTDFRADCFSDHLPSTSSRLMPIFSMSFWKYPNPTILQTLSQLKIHSIECVLDKATRFHHTFIPQVSNSIKQLLDN